MSEQLEIYDLSGKLLKVQEREKFYKEIKQEYSKKSKITKKVKAVRLILLNSAGRIYLQKRSKLKKENSGLYDKTIGGHVLKGHSWKITIIKECAEELGFPVAVLSEKEFEQAIHSTDLATIGLSKKIDYISNFNSVRIRSKGKMFIQPYMSTIYVGYYDGSIRFSDGESSGIEVFSLDELKKEIKNNPKKFTEDIKFMVKKYEKYLKPIT